MPTTRHCILLLILLMKDSFKLLSHNGIFCFLINNFSCFQLNNVSKIIQKIADRTYGNFGKIKSTILLSSFEV